MDVDEARAGQLAAGVDLVAAAAGQPADLDDAPAGHRHIGLAQDAAITIGQLTAA